MGRLNVLFRIAVTIFLVEGLIMLALTMIGPINPPLRPAIDAVALVLVASPIIYFWVINPYISARDESEEFLEKNREELESRVEERTRELTEEIAEHKRTEEALKESEERFRDVAEATSDWIWEMGPDLKVAYVSPRYEEVFGTPWETVIGKSAMEIVRSRASMERLRELQDALTAHRDFRDFDYGFEDRESQTRHLRINGKAYFSPDGKFRGYRGTGTDITLQKRAEIDLRIAKEEAEGANRAKSEFLAVMSHELRSPLNAIIGFAEVIKDQMFGPAGKPQYVEYAGDIHTSGQHLLGLINDILDLSKIEAGKMELDEEEVAMAEVVDASLQFVKERINNKGLTLRTDLKNEPLSLLADRSAVQQMLLNLLTNAVEFTPEGGTITLSAASDDGGITLSVADTGIGIAAKDIQVVLQPFGQGKNVATRDTPGTGLGIPIVKSLIELHGGTLTIGSETGKGTTMVLKFPPERTIHQS